MRSGVGKLEFEFDNSADKLISSLQYMLARISDCVPAEADVENILFRSKVIITELLTNAIKHAGMTGTLFRVENDKSKLLISKIDKGEPLYLVDARNNISPDSAGANKRLVSADMLNSLYAIWEDENHIRFSSEEGSMDDFLSVEEVMEHFGILIITRSSDEFTYTYDKESKSNIFRVRIQF